MSQTLNDESISRTIQQVNAILQEAGATPRTGRTRIAVGKVPENTRITSLIDHTQLSPETIARQVEMLCFEAKEHGFMSVCVNSWYVPLAAELLKESEPILITVVGFPYGASLPQVNAYAAQESIAAGAREIDMVIPIGGVKSRDLVGVFEDISDVVTVCHEHPDEVICKVIIETNLLTEIEIVIACQLVKQAGADFVVSGTDYDSDISTDTIALMRQVVGEGVGVKAVGQIETLEAAEALVEAGANRIGTTSGVTIARQDRSSTA